MGDGPAEETYALGGKALTFNEVSEKILDSVREHFGVENVRRGLENAFDPLFFSSSELTAIEKCLPVVLSGKQYERLAYEYNTGVHAALAISTSFFIDASKRYLAGGHFPVPEGLLPADAQTVDYRKKVGELGFGVVLRDGMSRETALKVLESHSQGKSNCVLP